MKENSYKKGQMIWWNIFEYHTKGLLNGDEFSELMDTIYYYRQNKEKYKTLTLSPKVELVWQSLKEVIAKSEANHNYYENSKSSTTETITPNKDFEKPSMEDEYKVDIPNIQLEDEDIPADEPEPTLEPEPAPAPEPVFKLSSEPSDNKKRYYNFDTPKSSRINQYIEGNKGGIKLLGVQKELIPMIQQEGYTEDEAINIYKNIAIEVDKDYRAECPF